MGGLKFEMEHAREATLTSNFQPQLQPGREEFWCWLWREQTLILSESKSTIRSASFLAKLNWITAQTVHISRFSSGP